MPGGFWGKSPVPVPMRLLIPRPRPHNGDGAPGGSGGWIPGARNSRHTPLRRGFRNLNLKITKSRDFKKVARKFDQDLIEEE